MYKQLGGWVIANKLFIQLKIADQLWCYTKNDESQVQLFFVGWYEKNYPEKLFTITVLWATLQIGFLRSK